MSPEIPSKHLTCTFELNWEFDKSKLAVEEDEVLSACVPNDCKPPPDIQDAQVARTKAFKVGDSVEYKCMPGFVPKVEFNADST